MKFVIPVSDAFGKNKVSSVTVQKICHNIKLHNYKEVLRLLNEIEDSASVLSVSSINEIVKHFIMYYNDKSSWFIKTYESFIIHISKMSVNLADTNLGLLYQRIIKENTHNLSISPNCSRSLMSAVNILLRKDTNNKLTFEECEDICRSIEGYKCKIRCYNLIYPLLLNEEKRSVSMTEIKKLFLL